MLPFRQRCRLTPPQDFKGLVMNVAGSNCQPWTSFGKTNGMRDTRSLPYVVWVLERQALRQHESVVLLENSPNFPLKVFARHFRDTHYIVTLVLGPEHLGFPICRKQRT